MTAIQYAPVNLSKGEVPPTAVLKRGTHLFHGTPAPTFKKLRGPVAWLTPELDTAIHYGSATAAEAGVPIRIIEYALTRDVKLPAHTWVPLLHDYAAVLSGLSAAREWDEELIATRRKDPSVSVGHFYSLRAAQIFCAHGFDGYLWDQRSGAEIAICQPGKLLRYVGEQGVVIPTDD